MTIITDNWHKNEICVSDGKYSINIKWINDKKPSYILKMTETITAERGEPDSQIIIIRKTFTLTESQFDYLLNLLLDLRDRHKKRSPP